MKSKFAYLLLISILVILSGACRISSLTSSLFETPSGAVLYQDDFSDSNSSWEIFSNEKGEMDYFDSLFRIQVSEPQQMLLNHPGLDFTDVRVEADMIKVIGSSNDMFGLICRATDQQNYYFFVISSDGYYGIGKMIAGKTSMIDAQGMLPSENISQGKSKNHLRADCIGEHLSLSVNGQELVSVTDADLMRGGAGIIAGTLDDPENVVLFDNFSVINP